MTALTPHWRDTCITSVPTTHCNSLKHTALHCNAITMQLVVYNATVPATRCSIQHTATFCNILETYCNTWNPQYCITSAPIRRLGTCNTLQHTATHNNILQHTATYITPSHRTLIDYFTALLWTPGSSVQECRTCSDTLQHTATYCNILPCSVTPSATLLHC